MADSTVARVGGAAVLRALVRSRARAQTVYRTSFALDLLGSMTLALVEFGELYVVFSNVRVLGGLDLNGAILVFALSNIAFSLGDLAVGQLDNIPALIRTGTALAAGVFERLSWRASGISGFISG